MSASQDSLPLVFPSPEERSPVGFLLFDDRLQVLDVSASFARLYDCEPSWLLGSSLDALLSPKDRKGSRKLHQELLHYHGGVIDLLVGLRIQKQDTFTRLRLERDGRHWFAYCEPMAEGNLTFDLYREHAKWNRILHSSDEGVLILDTEHKISEFNEAFTQLLTFHSSHQVRLTDHALVGKSLFALVDPEPFAELRELLEGEKLALGMQITRMLPIQGRLLEVRLSPIVVPLQGFVGSCWLFRDLTRQLQREELARAKEVAEKASQAKSIFLASISHELRTPLNAIIGYAEMLAEEITDEQALEDLQKIKSSGDHLVHLINDILDLSKIEAGKVVLYPEEFSLQQELEHLRDTIAPSVRRNQNQLVLSIPEALGKIFIDRTRLRQVLLNPLSNACKFTHQGTITLSVRPESRAEQRCFVFAIEDTGIGMNPEQLERIFDSYAQAEASTTRNYGGTGLGLSITKKLCEKMGGQIQVHSRPGQGTTFTIELPASPPEAA